MAKASQTKHRLLENMALPYVTFGSPISARPAIRKGSNTLTALDGVMRRRPGFSTSLEAEPTTFDGTINNIFTWRRFNLNFFCMLSVATNNTSEVWKMEIGVDLSFVKIHTQMDSTATFHFIFRNGCVYFGSGATGSMKRYDGTTLTTWGIAGPTLVPLCSTVDNGDSSIDSSVDYHYRYSYWDALAGHESNCSEVNDCIGQWTDKAVQVQVFASTNPRVTHIRVYRTRDGGSVDPREMQELPISPVANVDATLLDYTEDADLTNNFGPPLLRNSPPPDLRNFVLTDSRAFGSRSNQVFFSGFDEISNGVDIECWPSGDSGNWWPFSDDIGALAKMAGDSAGVSVFMPGSIAKIDGELRAEMRRYTVDEFHGSRRQRATFGVGNEVAWLDIAKQVRLSSVGDISQAIRPDLKTVDVTRAQMVPYVSDLRNWIVLLDGINGTLYVLDSDTGNWQTPWSVGATAIWAGEIAAGQRVLLAAIGSQLWYMAEGTFTDRDAAYAADFRTSLVPIAPSNNPDDVQALDSVSLEFAADNQAPSDILMSLDELPSFDDSFVSIVENAGDPTHRTTEGKHLMEKRYTVPTETSVARRCAVWVKWDAADEDFELYSANVEAHGYENP